LSSGEKDDMETGKKGRKQGKKGRTQKRKMMISQILGISLMMKLKNSEQEQDWTQRRENKGENKSNQWRP